MPPQTATSGLMAKYGQTLDKAVKAHAKDETTYGFQKLPGGIRNGIAQVISCGFGQYKTGKYQGHYFFRAAATVIKPESVTTDQGVEKVRGLQTSIMEPVCETKDSNGEITTQEEHVKRILNAMRAMAHENFTHNASGGNLEALAAQILKAKPYIKFSTSFGKTQIDPKTRKPKLNPTTGKPYEPQVFENWHGKVEFTTEAGGGIEDGSGGPPDDGASENGQHVSDDNPPENFPVDATGGDGQDDNAPDSPDIDTLLEQANADDADAQNNLTDLAKNNGWGEQMIKDATTWEEVAEMARNSPDGGGDDDTTEAAEEWKPTKGATCKYKPPGGKNMVACEVTAVYGKNKTVDLKNLKTQAAYKGVSFADLVTG
jgi:hypothetical protein